MGSGKSEESPFNPSHTSESEREERKARLVCFTRTLSIEKKTKQQQQQM